MPRLTPNAILQWSVIDDANLTADQMISAYQRANDRKRVRIDEQYFQVIEDLTDTWYEQRSDPSVVERK